MEFQNTTPQTGVHEVYEGLRDFKNFEDYLAKWIRPHILTSLDTLFEGAKARWYQKERQAGSAGRGDFRMATVLLSVFDHFGAFLAKPWVGWLTPAENIARVAARIRPSLSDTYAILANMGRNALVHGAWPQTAVVTDVPDEQSGGAPWGFGLSFSASNHPERHDTFHVRPYRPSGIELSLSLPKRTIKLVWNVHRLRLMLVDAVESGILFAGVDPQTFERVRLLSQLVGDTRETADAEITSLKKPGHNIRDPTRRKRHLKRVGQNALCKKDTMFRQIAALLAEANRLNVPLAGPDDKILRDYKGLTGAQGT